MPELPHCFSWASTTIPQAVPTVIACLGSITPACYCISCFVFVQRRKSTEPLYNQLPGMQLYIGGWPEQTAWLPDGKPSVLDVTCELPRTQFSSPYLCLPTWDTQGAII